MELFWRFLWSSILISLSACLSNVVDSVIVGNLIGEDGVSAINLSRPITQFMFTVNMLLASGAGILVGVELGKGNNDRASSVFTYSLISCLSFGLLGTFCGLMFVDSIAGWFCSQGPLFGSAHDYFIPLLIGAPTYMVSWALATMVSVDGSPRLVSFAILVDCVVNLLLDIFFIKVLGFGIGGASVTTVVGHVVGIAVMSLHFCNKNHRLKFFLEKGVILSTFRQIVLQGAPLALASICLTALFFCANSIVLSTMGRTGIFAFSVCMNVLFVYNLFLSGTCRTIQSLGAIQVGREDNIAFRFVVKKSFKFITVAMLVTCAIIWIFPETIVRFFGADELPLIVEGTRALRIFALSFIPFCYIYALMIVYKLYGHHRMALFISLALSLTVIPVLWIISKVSPDMLWFSYLVAYVIEALLIAALHRMGHVKFELVKKTA